MKLGENFCHPFCFCLLKVFDFPVQYDFLAVQYDFLLPCLQTIRVWDRDSLTVIGRTRHVTSPIWSRIDWLTGPKIRIVGLSFADVETDETVHLEFHLPLPGRSKHQFK